MLFAMNIHERFAKRSLRLLSSAVFSSLQLEIITYHVGCFALSFTRKHFPPSTIDCPTLFLLKETYKFPYVKLGCVSLFPRSASKQLSFDLRCPLKFRQEGLHNRIFSSCQQNTSPPTHQAVDGRFEKRKQRTVIPQP